MGVKATNGESKALLKKQMSQPRLIMKSKQKINNTNDVTKVTVNNVITNNLNSDFSKINLKEAPGVKYNKNQEANSFCDDINSENYKATSCVINKSIMNNVINNILDQNKNHINSNATKYHIKKNISYKSFSQTNMPNRSKQNEVKKLSEIKEDIPGALDVKSVKEINTKESENNLEILIIVDDETLKSHAAIWELMLDLENATDTKPYLSLFSNKLLKQLEDEILQNKLTFELFSNSQLNKTYKKIIKIVSIMIVFLKHISLDYNYENAMRNNVKKFIGSINEHLLNFVENYVFSRDGTNGPKFSKEFIEKHTSLLKHHKIKKITKDMAFSIIVNGLIYKNLETAVNSVKLFSTNFFKIGYFKPLHTICYDIFKSIETYSVTNIITLITKYILFYLIHAESAIREKLANASTSNKQTMLSSVFIGMGTGANVHVPFLPQADPDKYCLVLDLDETLVHFFFVI